MNIILPLTLMSSTWTCHSAYQSKWMEITVFWDVTQHILTNRYHNCRHSSLSVALKQSAQTSLKTYDGLHWIITFLYGPKYSKNVSCITLAFCFHENILRMTYNQPKPNSISLKMEKKVPLKCQNKFTQHTVWNKKTIWT